GEAVAGDAPPTADADGGDLGIAHPHARQACEHRGPHAEVGAGGDQAGLQPLHVGAHAQAPFPEVQDRVAHDLARPVVGYVAAAVDVVDLDPLPPAALLVPDQ